jgi:hypothetical protein
MPFVRSGLLDISSFIHAAVSGWMLFASMAAMSTMALPFIASRKFTAFYRTHVIFALLTGIFAILHGFGSATWNGEVPMSIPGAIFWLGDVFVRICFTNSAAPFLSSDYDCRHFAKSF